MARMTFPSLLALTAFGLSSLPAAADLTAADVWGSFKRQMSVYGAVTASETQSGDSLAVSDIVMTATVEGAVSRSTLSGSLVFRELGDGTVAIDVPANMTANMSASDTGAASMSVTVGFTQQGLSLIASGAPGNIVQTFSAPSMTYTLSDLTVDGDRVAANMDVGLTNLAGTLTSEGTATSRQRADYTIDAMTLKGLVSEPGKSEKVAFDVKVNALTATSDTAIPEGLSDLKPEQIFASGFAADADISFGPVTYAVQVDAEGQKTQINGTMADGSFGVGMNADRVRYSTLTNGMAMSGAITGLPFPPVDVSYDTSQLDVLIPLGQTEEAQDFGAKVALKGLKVSDFLWGMIDPAQQLPRDAADVVLDLDGKANWLVDIFDEKALASTKNPGKLESLTLNALEVNIAGASLTGDGGFTFDNNDLQTFGGMPRPVGAINLAMSGGITLLDKLTAMQLVPKEQAMGFKMMSGLFAKPGPTPDTLTTRIEIDPSGAVLANGQRIQ